MTAIGSDSLASAIDAEMFASRYANVYEGDDRWKALEVKEGDTYDWPTASTYVANPPFFDGLEREAAPVADIVEARSRRIRFIIAALP
ncbi:aconitase A [Sphingobium sp. OAS761]|uniref:hypothetical protein n=1 Tax=Sphingobium sp. OAS761 TaxID=2817901 RepID=UPI0020A12DBE|nr:hypothetical protein [Sphingobium sp. OAS761]MCP1469449.1 aconitase A [Sphingobium sp. OAS761]